MRHSPLRLAFACAVIKLAGARHVISLSPAVEAQAEARVWPGFGSGALALSGDGGALIVSVESFNGSCGAAYVYGCNSAAMTCGAPQVVALADGRAHDGFSRSLAISGDGLTAAFGAPGRNGGAGAVYTSACRSSAICDSLGAVVLPQLDPGDGYGGAVSLSHDGSMLAVGSSGYRNGTGAVFVLGCARGRCGVINSVLDPLSPLPGPAGMPLHFGSALALSADGFRLVISAPQSCCGESGRFSTGFGE